MSHAHQTGMLFPPPSRQLDEPQMSDAQRQEIAAKLKKLATGKAL